MEFTFGYKRDSMGKARIFLHHSSKPYSNAEPFPPLNTRTITTTHEGVAAHAITEDEVHSLQETWGNAIKDISAAYLENGDYMAVANDAAGALYGYGHSNVLFKPTKAAEHHNSVRRTLTASSRSAMTTIQS